ncbi:MAG: tetratricopeptide repeat protein [Verrucomicrobiota bacterium]|nr:tetratricopeptide repeat protein [Verrucomicrobiota bacterium]
MQRVRHFGKMQRMNLRCVLLSVGLCAATSLAHATPAVPAKALPVTRNAALDDSFRRTPAPDLALTNPSLRKADALAMFVEGARLEESGEVDQALAAYQKVLAVDPGEIQLASRVASLLVRQENIPLAVDVLKDAIKANPKETSPYLQLAFIYSKYLQKPDQAVKYANQAIAINPEEIDAYQRIYEIELTSGNAKKAMAALERASNVQSHNPTFWTRLGKIYAALILAPDTNDAPEALARVNALFKRAIDNAGDDVTVLRDVADYFAASQQIQEAIPLYLRILEAQPDDQTAREKLAASFAATNQRGKAIELLEQIIKASPEQFQPYSLLAQLQDEEARALWRAKQTDAAKALFAKAAANYEQCILINPNRGQTYLRLGELLLSPLQEADRAEKILTEARGRFAQAPEFTYLLAIAQREAKHSQQAVATFEEALQEAKTAGGDLVNARFYFDYASAAEQAGLYDKAADLLQQSIALDPAKAAEAYNFLGYMWADRDMHLDQAEEMIGKALELDPDNGAYLDSRGWLYFKKGKYDDALRDLLRAAQTITRDDPVVFEHIGDTYGKLGRTAQALEFWQKADSLNPGNKALADKIESTKTKLSKGDPKTLPVP